MPASPSFTLGREERIASRKLLDKLFGGGHSRSMVAFPLRLVYMETGRECGGPPSRMLVSVPKRCFKRAVKRNRARRQVREAYRRHKHLLWDALERQGKGMALAFIWLDDNLHGSAEVEARVKNLLRRVAEKSESL